MIFAVLAVIAALIAILLLGIFGAGVGALIVGAVIALGWLLWLLIPLAGLLACAVLWAIWWAVDPAGARQALKEAEERRANAIRRGR